MKNIVEQNSPEQNSPVQNNPEQNNPEQNNPEQNNPEQNNPEQNSPEQNSPEQNNPEQNNSEQEGLFGLEKEQIIAIVRVLISGAVLLLLHFISLPWGWSVALYLVAYLISGYETILEAWEKIREKEVFSEDFLMTIATIGAFAIGEYSESVAVMIFFTIGELFEDIAVGKSRKSISELMDIRPDKAVMLEAGEERVVSPSTVPVGSLILVSPGEKIPLDGIVEEGEGMLDVSALTGESVPKSIGTGDEVLSGCINMNGVIKIRTSKEYGDSTASKILELVENAAQRKSGSERFITKFAHYYTPIVCLSALALALIPPVIRIAVLGVEGNWTTWLYYALSFLVTSCPCALVISIPLTFFAGLGMAGRCGILVKGSNYLEALSKVRTVVFDKTGTLTKGSFEVIGVHHNIKEEEAILEIAALAESRSSHPVAKSIVRAASSYGELMTVASSHVSEIVEHAGKGITAIVDTDGLRYASKAGKVSVAVGNAALMEELGVRYEQCSKTGTIVHIAVDNVYEGHILISDSKKNESEEAVSSLKKLGIEKTVMLTGDRERVAQAVAEELKIDEVYAELLPGDKMEKLESFIENREAGKLVAFVGDGINDAPVLNRADVGIAMGAMGSDAAIEAADVVLMDDNPLKIPVAIRIAEKAMKLVVENIALAIGIKAICLVLIPLGIVGMEAAIFADVGVMILAVVNSLRMLVGKSKY